MSDNGSTLGRVHDAITYGCGWRWPVFPVRANEKDPATRHGFKDATCDLDRILAWWDAQPDYNIGIATGEPSGLVVIDVDSYDALPDLTERLGPLPPTLAAWTPRGGVHALYRHPGIRVKSTAGKLAPGIDVRADGGYIVAVGSATTDGRYEWRDDPYPGPPDLPDLPDAWIDAMNGSAKPVPDPNRAFTTAAQPLAGVAGRTTGWVIAALRGELEAVATAPEGTRNDRLNRAAFRCGQFIAAGVADRGGVHESLHAAARRAGLSTTEADRTITSGTAAGMKEPAELPKEVA